MAWQWQKYIAHEAAQFGAANITDHGEMKIVARHHRFVMGTNVWRAHGLQCLGGAIVRLPIRMAAKSHRHQRFIGNAAWRLLRLQYGRHLLLFHARHRLIIKARRRQRQPQKLVTGRFISAEAAQCAGHFIAPGAER